MAASTKDALQTQKALQTLASVKGPPLPEVISTLEGGGVKHCAASDPMGKDITADFLTPPKKPKAAEHPESNITVYKGILRRLAGTKPKPGSVAILAGANQSVTCVVVADSVTSALTSSEVLEFWKGNGHDILGLAIWEDLADPSKYKDDLSSLSIPEALFLAFWGDLNPRAWAASRTEEASEVDFQRVSVSCQDRIRRKHDRVCFVHASKIGVTFDDEVSCNANAKMVSFS